MAKNQNDLKTQKILSEQEKVHDFVKSEGWQIAKDKLYKLMGQVNSIVNIPPEMFGNPQAMAAEITQRYNSISIVKSWIKDIEGIANKHEFDAKALSKVTEEEVVINFE